MTRVLKLQCDSGISGDMVVGALLHLGADQEGLMAALQSLGLEGYRIKITKKLAGALEACDFDVVMEEGFHNHDHDMEWLFGDLEGEHHAHGHDHHHHDHDHHDHHHHDHHHHDHDHHDHEHHDHDHHEAHGHAHDHSHVHRNLADIRAIVDGANLSSRARKTALRVFQIIAEAEAKAHGQTVDTVHFHEVGAVDSIVDVVAAAWCLDNLGVEDVVVSPLAEGEGSVRSAHGVLSIPVPAVANIAETHGLVLKRANRTGELVTPTGAAIAAAIGNRASMPELYRLVATGIGTGKRAYDPPSTLRAFLVEEVANSEGNEQAATSIPCPHDLWKLESEVDDCTGEALGYILEKLYDAGAKEAHFLPVFMKKGRPGYQIEVLCSTNCIAAIEEILFLDTTTIGVRRYPLERTALLREQSEVVTPYGMAQVKCVVLPNGRKRCYPEHQSVARIAKEEGLSYQDATRAVIAALEAKECGHGCDE